MEKKNTVQPVSNAINLVRSRKAKEEYLQEKNRTERLPIIVDCRGLGIP